MKNMGFQQCVKQLDSLKFNFFHSSGIGIGIGKIKNKKGGKIDKNFFDRHGSKCCR